MNIISIMVDFEKWMEGDFWIFNHIWELFLVIFLLLIILFFIMFMITVSENSKLKSLYLKMKIEPHTIRNMFEEMRIKTKKLNKQSQEINEIANKINDFNTQVGNLYEKINRDTEFLSYLAEDDELRHDVVPISKELDFAQRLIDRYQVSPDSYKIVNKLNDDIKIPSMITQSMIENAFKYGDREASDFLTVTFAGPDNNKKYTIQVKNKMAESFDEDVYSTRQGIKNLVERIANYNINSSDYTATPKKACKNGYYIFKIDFSPN